MYNFYEETLVIQSITYFQSFGTAEGGRVQDLREMAEAAGQTFLDFTPPEGETQEQVGLLSVILLFIQMLWMTRSDFLSFFFFLQVFLFHYSVQ